MTKLLPCPFCGHDKIFLNDPSANYPQGCINCPACLATLPGAVSDQTELVQCWNTRAALGDAGVVPAEVVEIVSLYFAPWGAAKGARWEALSGDQPFNAEIAMSLIEAALSVTRHNRDGVAE